MGSYYSALKNIPNAEHIILYGSHAISMAHAKSDLDLLVLTKDENQSKAVEEYVSNHQITNASIFTFSKQSFLNSRSCLFFYNAPLEFALRYGHELKGDLNIKMRPDTEIVAQLWVSAMFLTTYWKDLTPGHAAKELYRGSILLWHLEGLLKIQDIYSINHFSQYLLINGKDRFEHDPLWAYLDSSGGHWKWLDLDLAGDCDPKLLEEWATHLKWRLLKYRYLLEINLYFNTISLECLKTQLWCPLFYNVPWEEVDMKTLKMKDHGERFLFNFIKLCFGRSMV